MRIFFFFLDGIGIGPDDPATNPFAAADLPTLTTLSGGNRWLSGTAAYVNREAVYQPIDANLGVVGKPQSATGQATIHTGVNVPAQLGYHYGPKPNADIRAIIDEHSVGRHLAESGHSVALLNAYPSGFMDGITSGKRLMSSNQYALHVGQVLFRSGEALYQRRAVSIDYTNEMWFKRVAEHDAAWVIWKQRLNEAYPILSPFEAGQLIGNLAAESDFTFLDDWLTDYIGHKGTIEEGNAHLEKVDDVMRGILSVWDMEGGLILLTSDHGNMESIDERGHTTNPVPLLVVGRGADDFAAGITDLSGLAPAIRRTFSL